MSEFVEVFIEMDDNTYIYGGNTYKIEKIDGVCIEPYILVEDNITVKYYRTDKYFAVYNMKNKLVEIIFVETCWSDDFIAYKVNEIGIAYERSKVYHGRPVEKNKQCNVDLNQFIADNKLM